MDVDHGLRIGIIAKMVMAPLFKEQTGTQLVQGFSGSRIGDFGASVSQGFIAVESQRESPDRIQTGAIIRNIGLRQCR